MLFLITWIKWHCCQIILHYKIMFEKKIFQYKNNCLSHDIRKNQSILIISIWKQNNFFSTRPLYLVILVIIIPQKPVAFQSYWVYFFTCHITGQGWSTLRTTVSEALFEACFFLPCTTASVQSFQGLVLFQTAGRLVAFTGRRWKQGKS